MVAARRILVVDDETMVTQSCRRILALDGHEVETTQSGRDGLQRALAQHFDLVMTDLRMPDLDGMELVRAVRRQSPGTGIIIITGYGTVPSAVAATKLGVSDYIEKPFAPNEIIAAVRKALPAGQSKAEIDADMVRSVLRLASENPEFSQRLLTEGSRVLSGFGLSAEAEAAIASGDIAWIEKNGGELSPEEREWLERRLQAEIW